MNILLRHIRHESLRSLDFTGRTAPLPYLAFLSVAIFLFSATIYMTKLTLPAGQFWTAVAAITLLYYIPVTSAGVRRLHDVGYSGIHMLDPLKPALAVATCALVVPLLYQAIPGPLGLGILWVLIIGLGHIIFFAAIAAAIIATLVFFSNTMGTLLLPSQPGPNQYGPNPREVSP